CLPFVERLLPWLTRDFRALLRIHAAGLRHIVDNQENLSPKDRAFHLSAELYLFQHSCHWFCKSRSVADARLMLRHKVDHRKVLGSVTERTRRAYLGWLQGTEVKPRHCRLRPETRRSDAARALHKCPVCVAVRRAFLLLRYA